MEDFYEHPFVVSNAVLEIESDIVKIHRSMKDVTLAENDEEIEEALLAVDAYEEEVYANIDIVYEQYLGEKEQIEGFREAFENWKPIREEVVALVEQGDIEEALSGKTDINKLYESDTVLAFHHTNPSYEFHVVIVPKVHITDLLATTDKHNPMMIEIINVAKKIIKSEIDIENSGAKLVTNLGEFQDTPHLHFHLISGKQIK